MNFMNSIHALIIIAFLPITVLSASEWPDSMEEVIGEFAGPINQQFERGIRFSPGKRPVTLWNNAEVIWRSSRENSDFIPQNSSLIVMQDSNDFRAFYKGIKMRSIIPSNSGQSFTIGTTRNSHSWVMEMFDMRSKRIVNPLLLLPTRQNLPSAEIKDIIFSKGNWHHNIIQDNPIPQGTWNVSFNLVLPSGRYLNPQNAALYWLGNRLSNIKFDGLTEENHKILLESNQTLPYEAIYTPQGRLYFKDIVFGPGDKIIELHLRDELSRLIIRTFSLKFY